MNALQAYLESDNLATRNPAVSFALAMLLQAVQDATSQSGAPADLDAAVDACKWLRKGWKGLFKRLDVDAPENTPAIVQGALKQARALSAWRRSLRRTQKASCVQYYTVVEQMEMSL